MKDSGEILTSEKLLAARIKLRKVVMRRISSELEEPSANYDAELEYCDDMIDEAACELAVLFGYTRG